MIQPKPIQYIIMLGDIKLMTFYLNTIQTRQEPAQLTPNLEYPTEVTQNSWLRLKIKSMGHERYKQKIPMSPSLRIQPNPTMRRQKTEGHSNGGIKPPCVCHFQLYYVPTLEEGGWAKRHRFIISNILGCQEIVVSTFHCSRGRIC